VLAAGSALIEDDACSFTAALDRSRRHVMLKNGAFDFRTTRSANVLSLLSVSMIAVAMSSPAVRARVR
jgi:hypothetical protein